MVNHTETIYCAIPVHHLYVCQILYKSVQLCLRYWLSNIHIFIKLSRLGIILLAVRCSPHNNSFCWIPREPHMIPRWKYHICYTKSTSTYSSHFKLYHKNYISFSFYVLMGYETLMIIFTAILVIVSTFRKPKNLYQLLLRLR